MNQPPTPLGLQETIAESIYVTRPLLHCILPWLHESTLCTLVPAEGAMGSSAEPWCGVGPPHAPLPTAALVVKGPGNSSIAL